MYLPQLRLAKFNNGHQASHVFTNSVYIILLQQTMYRVVKLLYGDIQNGEYRFLYSFAFIVASLFDLILEKAKNILLLSLYMGYDVNTKFRVRDQLIF